MAGNKPERSSNDQKDAGEILRDGPAQWNLVVQKFASLSRRVLQANFRTQGALESQVCWCPFESGVREGKRCIIRANLGFWTLGIFRFAGCCVHSRRRGEPVEAVSRGR